MNQAYEMNNSPDHGVSFDLSALVFSDAKILSIPDEQHSDTEQLALTLLRPGVPLGRSSTAPLRHY